VSCRKDRGSALCDKQESQHFVARERMNVAYVVGRKDQCLVVRRKETMLCGTEGSCVVWYGERKLCRAVSRKEAVRCGRRKEALLCDTEKEIFVVR
jgi:hypothetical protein